MLELHFYPNLSCVTRYSGHSSLCNICPFLAKKKSSKLITNNSTVEIGVCVCVCIYICIYLYSHTVSFSRPVAGLARESGCGWAVSNQLSPPRHINCTARLSLCSCMIVKNENNVPYDRRWKCCPPTSTRFGHHDTKLWFTHISCCAVIKFISVLIIIFQFI